MPDIVSIGSATIDIFVKSKDFIEKKLSLSLLRSSKNEISHSLFASGGGATNTSVSFSRLGLKSACLALIGNDPLAGYIKTGLKKEKVQSLLVSDTEPCDFSIILVASDGSRSILTNRGRSKLETNHIDWGKIQKYHWFYLSSLEGNLDLIEKIIGFALENHIKVALNPGNREINQPQKLIPLLSSVNFLLLNREEIQNLTGLTYSDSKFWPKIKSFGSQIVAITAGRQGAEILTDQSKYYSPVLNSLPVDETGAGDAFGSAFVAGLIHGLSPPDALFWAIKNSASVVSALGAKPGLLTLKQIKS